MAASLTLFGAFHEHIAKGTIDLDTDTFKVALVKSTYTPVDNTHAVLADVVLGSNEVAAGNGYTANGVALASVSVTRSGAVVTFDADDATWTASGGTIPAWRYAVIYKSGTANSLVNPLVGYVLGDTSPADIAATADGATLRLRWNASGIFTL